MKHLPIEIVYEEYNNGATTIELSEKYNCSVTTIRKRLIEYCEQTGLEFKKRSRGPFKKELPKEKIYNEYINGESSPTLAEKYGCSKGRILNEIKRYARRYNLPLYIKSNDTRPVELPIEKVYEEYINGKDQQCLAEEYDCSSVTISRKLTRYCKENNIDLLKTKKDAETKKLKKLYEEHKSGLTPTELSEKYNCSKRIIILRLHDYANLMGEELVFPRKSYDRKNISDEEIYNLYLDGYTIGDIAKSKNLTKRTISEELYAYLEREGKNLKIRSGRKRQELPSEKIYLEYRNGKTMQEIAEEYQCSATTIADRVISYCKANNIPFPKHNIRVSEETSKKIYELSRGGMQQVKIAKETGYGKKKIERILKNEYKKAFLEQLKKMLEEKQIKKETDTNVKVKKY